MIGNFVDLQLKSVILTEWTKIENSVVTKNMNNGKQWECSIGNL